MIITVVLVGTSLACTVVSNLFQPTQKASPVPSASIPAKAPQAELPVIPATPTPTLIPTPTPLPGVRIESGDEARFRGNWDRALDEYQSALTDSADADTQSAALLGLGRTQVQAGAYQDALETLNKLTTSFPQSAQLPYAHFVMGQAYEYLGRSSEAADAYLNYLIQRPGLVDSYILNLRGDALQAGGRYGEALVDYRAATQSPGMLDSFAIELKIARAHAAVGDHGTALGMYQDLYNRTSDDYTKAQIDYLMGQSYTASGQMEQAYAVYLDAVNNYPTAFDSYQGLLLLVEAGIPVDELNRGIVDTYAGQYAVAIAAFDRYLQVGGIDPAAAQYYYGICLRALGSFDTAISKWDVVIQNYPESRLWDDAWEQKAFTQWQYMNLYTDAVQTLLNFVAADPNHPRAGEFLYDAGRIAEQDNQLEQASQIWERTANEYSGYDEARFALFLAGITHYRFRDYTGALALLQRSLENAVTLGERSAAYFWQGKAHQASGNIDAATAAWELAANLDPTGYYSERARDLLLGRTPFAPPQQFDLATDPQGEREQAEAWMRSVFSLPEDTDFSAPGSLIQDARFVRGSELWELGLYEEARLEFENLRTSIQDDPVANYRLATTLIDLGMYRTAILAARQVLNLAGMSDADTLNAPIYFNHIRFGAYFSDLILPAAHEHNFHPLFLFSVVRQESAFEGFVRSFAGARGLMQIIPATGQEIATELGWPPDYNAEDLYRPLVSVTLGADYLAKWRDHLDGDIYAALAAYNGGPGNAIAWHKLANGDPDLFLEIVRYEETRNYIRGIYELFNIYRRIYARTP